MKKIICIALALVMVLALCACGSTAPKASDTDIPTSSALSSEPASSEPVSEPSAEPTETFVFKQGFDLDYPPYSYLNDDGEVGGFDVEMCQALCEYMGWGYEPVPFNWDAKDAELNAGSCDCIWSGFTMNGLEDKYSWSVPYSDNTQMILVAASSGIETLDDLAGKTVGVQTATSAYTLLNDEEGQAELCSTFGSLEVYETYTIAFNDLQAGAIDAIAIDVTVGQFLISGTEGYVFLDETLGSEQYAIAFRLEDTELRDQVNEALQALVNDGTYDKIGQKYPDIYDLLCLEAE